MKVCYLTNIPSPYRVDYFNELGKYCELTVFFEKRRSNERNVEWGHDEFKTFKGVFLDGISVATDAAFSLKGIAAVKKISMILLLVLIIIHRQVYYRL